MILNDAYLECILAMTGQSFWSVPVETETDLFGFGLYKYYEDENGGQQPLAGAKFILSEEGIKEDGTTGTRYATFTTEVDEDGKVYYLTDGWVDDRESAGILTTGEDGFIRIEGLDDDTYILTETQAPAGYKELEEPVTVILGEDDSVTVEGNDSVTKEEGLIHQFEVKDEIATMDLSGTKTWDDKENQDGKRPESITIHLFADSEEVDSVTVSKADGWSWTFSDLPTYKDGVEIVYTIAEDTVEDYTAVPAADGSGVTNSYTPG